jgi:hypothetical protein
MGMRSGVNAPAVLIDKYINTAYDKVKVLVDNIDYIVTIADEISDGNTAISITILEDDTLGISVTDDGTTTSIDLNEYDYSYTMGRNQLQVFVNGIYQSIESGSLVEVNTTVIKLNGLVSVGDQIDIIKII